MVKGTLSTADDRRDARAVPAVVRGLPAPPTCTRCSSGSPRCTRASSWSRAPLRPSCAASRGWPASQVGRLERADDGDDGHVDVLRGLLHLLGPLTPEAGRRVPRLARPGRAGPVARRRRRGRRRRDTPPACSTPTSPRCSDPPHRAARPPARPVRPVPAGPRPGAAGPRHGTPQGTLAHPRPARARCWPTARSSAPGDRARRARPSRWSWTSGCPGRGGPRAAVEVEHERLARVPWCDAGLTGAIEMPRPCVSGGVPTLRPVTTRMFASTSHLGEDGLTLGLAPALTPAGVVDDPSSSTGSQRTRRCSREGC